MAIGDEMAQGSFFAIAPLRLGVFRKVCHFSFVYVFSDSPEGRRPKGESLIKLISLLDNILSISISKFINEFPVDRHPVK